MTWKIVVMAGPARGAEFHLSEGKPLILGRGSASDTQIADPKLSRIHCQIALDKGKLYLTDVGSAGGTFLHGKRISSSGLDFGDEVVLGDTTITVKNANAIDEKTLVGNSENQPAKKTTRLEDLIGKSINRFTVERLVSKGKNGIIFKGLDQADGKAVAIKVLNPQNTIDERQQERFIRAMRTVLPIRHPHIVRLYRAGRQANLCWAAMEWIHGTSLREIIDLIGVQGTLDWRDVWRIGVHVSRALAEAEKRKIVHRNVTPY